jgi:glycosyltransferase involved in cell wall biosynthesis
MEAAADGGVEAIAIRAKYKIDPRIVWTTLKVVKERRIDIIHSHDYKSDILAWAVSQLHRVAIMSTVHGYIWNNLRYHIYWRLSNSLLPRFDRVVAVSGQTRELVRKLGVRDKKLALIHNGIVAENYVADRVQPWTVRDRFGIPRDARVIGCVGRLSYEKGQRDLLQAAVAVLKTHPDVWFLFAGEGPDRPFIERQVADNGIGGRVVFTGHLSDVRPVFRDIDVLALTSHTEGFPNVVLESLCMDTPVLATDVGGVSEIITDGVTGVLLPPHRPDRIAEGLRAMLDRSDWARSLAMAGKALVMKEFTFERRVRKEEALSRAMLTECSR